MIPNAPGSQGYNLYAYAANNPTTWTDPTGYFVRTVLDQQTVDRIFWEVVRNIGLAFTLRTLLISHPVIVVIALIAFVVVAAVLYYFLVVAPNQDLFQESGSESEEGVFDQTIDALEEAAKGYPPPPEPPTAGTTTGSCDAPDGPEDGLGPYSMVGGHHIHAKAAFRGIEVYDPGRALAIGQDFMAGCGIRHSAVTAAQRELFRELAQSGRPNTLVEHTRIAEEALVRGGASRDLAQLLAAESEANLLAQGVTAPSGIPWYG